MTYLPGSTGAVLGAATGAVNPPVTPTTTTSTPSLYAQALAQAQQALQAQINPLQGQIASNDATASQRVNDAIASATALSNMLKQIAPAIQGIYTNAANDQGILGKGYSQQLQDSVNTDSAAADKTLAGIGAPSGQMIDPSKATAAGDVLYGLGGAIPGTTFAQEGAGYAGAAAMLPATALLQGATNAQQVRLAAQAADVNLQNQIATLAGKLPGDAQTNYMNLQKAALDSAKFAETLKNDSINQAAKIAASKLAVAKYKTQIGEFNVTTGLKTQSLQLQANKFAQSTLNQDRNYGLALQRLGISQKSLQLRITAAAYTQAHGGYTAKQVAAFGTKLDALVASAGTLTHAQNGVMPTPTPVDANGKPIPLNANGTPKSKPAGWVNNNTYSNFIKAALKKGVPVQLAIQRANTMWPETERGDLGALTNLPAVAAQAAKIAHDNALTTGRILGTSPNGVDIHWNASTVGLTAKGKQVVSGVLSLAQEYLGTPYAWGGASPTGFDCSGLAQYIYAKEGITIPRTTYTQFQSGLAVPKNQLQPGDLVFFKGSDSKGGLPGHVGIYIGGQKFVEAPHTGDVVRVSSLSGYPGYMGARRFVH